MLIDLAKAEVMHVQPGDHVVLTLEHRISRQEYMHILDVVRHSWHLPEDVTVVLLDPSMTLGIVRPGPGETLEITEDKDEAGTGRTA